MKVKFSSILLFLFLLVLAALFTGVGMEGADEAQTIIRTKNTRVELEATISGWDEHTEIDEGYESTRYEAKVSYTYQGKTYSGVRYETFYKEPQLGKVVKVAIDPENPGELLLSNSEFTLTLVMSPIFLIGVTFCVFALTKSAAEVLQEKWKWINPEKAAYGLTICKLVGESYFRYQNKGSWMFGVFSLVAAVACLLIVKKVKKKQTEEPQPAAGTIA